MYHMKEQDKTPEKQLKEVEIDNLPEKEFRIIIVKMIQDLRKRMEAKIEKMQEMFNKDLEELKNRHIEELQNKQTKMNNTVTKMKNTVEGINSRITEAEEWISVLEDRMVKFTAMENMNRPVTSTEIETVIKFFQQTKVQDQMASQVNSIKHLEKS